MRIVEIVLAGLAFIAILFKLFTIPLGGLIFVLSLTTLSLVYFFGGFLLFNDIGIRKLGSKQPFKDVTAAQMVGSIFLGFTLSLLAIGLVFKLQLWPLASRILIPGIFTLTAMVIAAMIAAAMSKKLFTKSSAIRMAIWLVIGISAALLPQGTWIDILHRNDPEYAKVVKEYHANPDDPEVQQKLDEMNREKMEKRHKNENPQ